MPTEEQKDNEEREGGELEAGSARRDADESADDGDEGTVTAAAGSSDADSSDDDGRDEDDEASEAEASAASASSSASPSAATKRAAARASAGARLAAAKAAKAAKKAAKKAQLAAESEGADADSLIGTGGGMPAKDPTEVLVESPIGQAATKASEWASSNRSLAAGIVGVLVVGALGWVSYSWWNASQAEAAGALLTDALEIANAEIVSADAESASDDDEDEPTFETREARAEAALEAYRRVLTDYPGAEAARWALLGEAKALFDLGRNDEAREAYERALRESGRDPIVAWRALEGIGFTYEAEQQWDEAIAKYQELRSIEDGAFEAPADFHIARMRIAKGERVEATTALRGLVERLRPEEATEEPAFPYVLAQAEVRLRELDPGSGSGSGSPLMLGPGGAGGGGLPPGLEGIDPQILEQLRRQLGAAGGGEGAPE